MCCHFRLLDMAPKATTPPFLVGTRSADVNAACTLSASGCACIIKSNIDLEFFSSLYAEMHLLYRN